MYPHWKSVYTKSVVCKGLLKPEASKEFFYRQSFLPLKLKVGDVDVPIRAAEFKVSLVVCARPAHFSVVCYDFFVTSEYFQFLFIDKSKRGRVGGQSPYLVVNTICRLVPINLTSLCKYLRGMV